MEIGCTFLRGGHGMSIAGVDAYTARLVRDRINCALQAMCFALPSGHLKVTICPALAYVTGGFDETDADLAITLSVLGAAGIAAASDLSGWIALGSLDRMGRIGEGNLSPSVIQHAQQSGKGIIGGRTLREIDHCGVPVIVCDTLVDALNGLKQKSLSAQSSVAECYVPLHQGFWSKLLGRVADGASKSRSYPFGANYVPGREQQARGQPRPIFHGIGHRARLRARLIEGGAEALADYEVLEFILFGARRKGDTKPIAKALIRRFGSLPAVLNADPTALLQVPGIGPASVGVIKIGAVAAMRMARAQLRDQPVLGTWNALIDYLSIDMAHLTRERVRVLYLDGKNKLIRDEHISEGTIDEAIVHPREVIHHALDAGACGLILVHNHPSGDPEPSKSDITITNRIAEAGRLVDIRVLDHVIIGRSGHVSLRAKGLV